MLIFNISALSSKPIPSKNPDSAFYFKQGLDCLSGSNEFINAGLANFYFLKAIESAHKDKNIDILKKSYKAIGDSFYSGDGLDKSHNLSFDYYLKSAKLGYAPSIFNVAILYKEKGNMIKAKSWLKKYIQRPNADLKSSAKLLLNKMS